MLCVDGNVEEEEKRVWRDNEEIFEEIMARTFPN